MGEITDMKDILVHLNYADSLERRLCVTQRIATAFGAHVTGLYVQPMIAHEIYGSYVHPEIFDEFEKKQNEGARQGLLQCEQMLNSNKLAGCAIKTAGDSVRELNYRASAHDLVVVAQYNADKHFKNMAHVPTHVSFGCGRPVIIVPECNEQADVGKSVLVAWSGTRESTRALHDAMPLLERADYVNLVTFDIGGKNGEIIDIKPHLQRYGVTFDAFHSSVRHEQEVCSRLVDFARRYESDLLVMGAYGHSRLREYVLGGVSKSVFSESEIPVLVSH
jgi:nucleotide-binding universal stress UspA family protein